MPRIGPPEDEATPTSPESFNPPKASSATLAALLEALKAPPPTEGAPPPLPPAAGIAGAILGALDPEGYKNLVTPALAERKTEARRQYQTAREQRGENLQNLESAYELQKGVEVDQATEAELARKHKFQDLQYAKDSYEFEQQQKADDIQRVDAWNTFVMRSSVAEKDLDFADQEIKRLGNYPEGRPETDIMRRHARQIYAAQSAVREMLAGVQNDYAANPKALTPQYLKNATATFEDVESALKDAHSDEAKFAGQRLEASLKPTKDTGPKKYLVPTAVQNKIEFQTSSLSVLNQIAALQSDPNFKGTGGFLKGRLGAYGGEKQQALMDLYSQLNTLWIPPRLGANIPASDQELVAGAKPSITDPWDKQVRNTKTLLNYFNGIAGNMRKSLSVIYGRGEDEIDALMGDAGKNVQGARVPMIPAHGTYIFPPADAFDHLKEDDRYLATGEFTP